MLYSGFSGQRLPLTFEHVYDADQVMRTRNDVENKLMDACRVLKEDIRPETPKLFTELVYLLKSVDVSTLRTIYQKLQDKSLCAENNKCVKYVNICYVPSTFKFTHFATFHPLMN